MTIAKSVWISLVLQAVLTTSVQADIGLIYSDGRLVSVYQDSDKVYYRSCQRGEISNLTRDCVGKVETALSVDRREFHRRLNATMRIPFAHQGHNGVTAILKEINYYKDKQELAGLAPDALSHIETQLSVLLPLQQRLIALHRDLIGNLGAAANVTFDQTIEKTIFLNVVYAFYPNWFDGARLWLMMSPAADQNTAFKLCGRPLRLLNGIDLGASPTGRPNYEEVLNSPLRPFLQTGPSVWTSQREHQTPLLHTNLPTFNPGERERGVAGRARARSVFAHRFELRGTTIPCPNNHPHLHTQNGAVHLGVVNPVERVYSPNNGKSLWRLSTHPGAVLGDVAGALCGAQGDEVAVGAGH
ncbi:MAG: hypothetical protein HYR96_04860 [Deltaproteobacteria bacterium]|nr:hypothetical protein [Deltaproteobacteria bacterium]MBI3294582.1 hypothetical protein [Deltaproteobacteria bacterium]